MKLKTEMEDIYADKKKEETLRRIVVTEGWIAIPVLAAIALAMVACIVPNTRTPSLHGMQFHCNFLLGLLQTAARDIRRKLWPMQQRPSESRESLVSRGAIEAQELKNLQPKQESNVGTDRDVWKARGQQTGMLAQRRRPSLPDNADTAYVLRADLHAQVGRLEGRNTELEKTLREKSIVTQKALQRNTTVSIDLGKSTKQNGKLRACIDQLKGRLAEREKTIRQQTADIALLKDANQKLSQQLFQPERAGGLGHTGTCLCYGYEVGNTRANRLHRTEHFSTMRITCPPPGFSSNYVPTLQYGSSRQVYGNNYVRSDLVAYCQCSR
ncbi:AT-hook-containing transcription factor domain-containing protein [Cordyceps javanica]|nr:AT-hook-containing transcription factor domain-containing protein [Cordyceps javanica]